MASIFERLDNREAYPVEIKGGTVYVREPTNGELDRINASKQSIPLAFGFCLVTAEGKREFDQGEESDEVFAERMKSESLKIGPSAYRKIWRAILDLCKPVDPLELQKNSSGTGTHSSPQDSPGPSDETTPGDSAKN